VVTQAPRRAAVAVAVLFVLSCVGLIIYVWTQFGGTLPLGVKGYRIHADFEQASQLTPHADVRMAGVNVGKVVAVTARGLKADATIELEAKYAPLPIDARAILRQKTLLGETFVALTPGSRGARKIQEGGRLPDANVQATQQLDTVLGSFDPPTQRNLRRFLNGLSSALQGRGADINAALGNLDPTLSSLDRVVTILDRQSSSVRRLVQDTGTVLQTVGDKRADLKTLVGAGDQVLSATAARNRELTATIRALPPFLGQLRMTLHDVDTTAGYAAPTLRALRPVAPLVRPTLQAIIQITPQVLGVFHQLGPLITTSIRSLPAVTRIADATVPFADALARTTAQVMPVIALTKLYGTPITSAFANLASTFEATTPLADGTSQHYLRAAIPFSNESPVGATQRPGSNRHNSYPAPDVLSGVGHGGIAAQDCRNTSNPSPPPADPPPCHLAAPLSFLGTSSYYPRIPARP